jgi:hypothetical protein
MQCHQRALFASCILLFFVLHAKSRDTLVTEIVLIGTKHTSNVNFNSDSLFNVVMSLKPDVMLIEQDSISGVFKSGAFKSLPRWGQYLKKITGWRKKEVEGNMLFKYHRAHPEVIIKPCDVAFNGKERERFIKEYFALEAGFYEAMSLAYDAKEMSPYRETVHAERRQLISRLWQLIENGNLRAFNSDSSTQLIRTIQTLDKVHFKALVDSVDALKRYGSRMYKHLQQFEYRDEVMVRQIIRFIQAYRGKRILVISGFLHRYYQLDELAPRQEKLGFRLLDLDGQEMIFPDPRIPQD